MNYPIGLKKIVHNTKYAFQRVAHPHHIHVDWCKYDNNFGDILNPIIVQNFSSKFIINVNSRYCYAEHLLAIGSILGRATKNSIVWGSGFISSDSTLISSPRKIYAVRGPLTRQRLIDIGINCPEVYGDPALLLPYFYNPKFEKKYELGIIAHYVDKNSKWIKDCPENIKIINVQNPDPLIVINEMHQCENIASSSMHGLIVSDAYRIPSVWVQFSNKLTGGVFKFIDYYSSIHINLTEPLIIKPITSPQELIDNCSLKEMKIDLNKLANQFPVEFK